MLGSSGISGYDVVFAQAWRERTSLKSRQGEGKGEKKESRNDINSEQNDIFYYFTYAV